MAPSCSHCGATAVLTTGAAIYPHGPDLAEKQVWRCECGAYVGCHPGTMTPLGTPANKALRDLRQATHRLLDPIWRDAWSDPAYAAQSGEFRTTGAKKERINRTARKRVYEFLAEQMALTEDRCHVGMFDEAQCRWAIELLHGKHYAEIRHWAKSRRGELVDG